MTARRTGRLVVAIVVLTLVAVGCSSTGSKDEIAFGTDQEPTGFNLGSTKNASVATQNVVENIHFYAAKATPEFELEFVGLARPPTQVSSSPQVVEWVIKEEAVWDDGTPVTSEDLRYYYEQVMQEGNDVDNRDGYEQITKLDVTGPKSVQATFDPIYAEFPSLWEAVPQAAFMKAHGGWGRADEPGALDEEPGPSAGPYRFGKWDKGQSLRLEPNPRWWGPGDPTLDIVFRFLPDPSTQVRELGNGGIDLLDAQPQVDVLTQLEAFDDVRVDRGLTANWEQLTFNVAKPALADVRVRRAIAHTVDRNAIVAALVKPLLPEATPMDNFVYVKGQAANVDHDQAYERPDLDASRRLLDDAGWAADAGDPKAPRTKDGEKLSLRLSITAGNLVRQQQAELIAAQLAPVGIQIVIDEVGEDYFGERLPAGDFDIANFGWTGGVFAAVGIKSIYGSDAGSNFGKWKNPDFDTRIGEAVTVTDPVEQARLANEADQVLWAELPALPLYQRPAMLAVNARLDNVRQNNAGDGVFWNAQEWRLRD